MLEIVREYSDKVDDGRSLRKIANHLHSESLELDYEVAMHDLGYPGEDDGIVGESIDIILCALDMIFKYEPDITEKEINAIVHRKCEKWYQKYHKGS